MFKNSVKKKKKCQWTNCWSKVLFGWNNSLVRMLKLKQINISIEGALRLVGIYYVDIFSLMNVLCLWACLSSLCSPAVSIRIFKGVFFSRRVHQVLGINSTKPRYLLSFVLTFRNLRNTPVVVLSVITAKYLITRCLTWGPRFENWRGKSLCWRKNEAWLWRRRRELAMSGVR